MLSMFRLSLCGQGVSFKYVAAGGHDFQRRVWTRRGRSISSLLLVAEVTADVAYVRFHGRNYETWEKRGTTASERFDWYYQGEELME